MMSITREIKKQEMKISKKRKKELAKMERIPTPRPGHQFDSITKPRKKRWSEED